MTLIPKEDVKLYYQMLISTKISEKLSYRDFKQILLLTEPLENLTIKTFLKDDTLLGEIYLSEKMQYGLMVNYIKKRDKVVYTLRIKKKNKSNKTIRNLSFKELLIEVKKLNNQ